MQLSCVKIDGANAKIEGVIVADAISSKIDGIALKASKTVKMDGFRKGKVPVSAVKAKYMADFQQEARSEVLRDMISAGLEQLGLAQDALLSDPSIVKFDENGAEISVEIKLSLRPTIDLGDYKKCIPAVKFDKVKDSDVDARILDVAKSSIQPTPIARKRKAKNGDIAVIDFEGFVNEVPFDGGKAEGFPLELGSGRFIPGFEEQVVGMSPGESKDVNVTFPENYGKSDLAAQPAVFKVTLHTIEEKKDPELNDELAKILLPNDEEATLEKLRTIVKEQMNVEAKNKVYNDELKPALMEKLLEKITFDLPTAIVDQEVDLLLRSKVGQLPADELEDLKNNPEKITAMREDVKPEATKSVKATFLIDELAKAEKIDVQTNEIFQAIYYEAFNMGQDPKAMLDYYQKNGMMPAVKMAMLEDKLLTTLLDTKLPKDAA